MPESPQAKHRKPSRHAFTLVEILVVIVIIGILAAIAIPAVNTAVVRARNTAIKLEVSNLGQSLEAYKLSYGDYPPDFSDWRKVERHYTRAFPEILDEELKILAQFCFLDSNFARVPPVPPGGGTSVDPRGSATYAHYRQCIDPAEALVFALGGFSTDAKRPFTGVGGPLSRIPGFDDAPRTYNQYQYNVDRDNAKANLEADGLTLFVANDPGGDSLGDPLGTGGFYTYSADELGTDLTANGGIQGDYSTRAAGSPFAALRFLPDPFPVYLRSTEICPLVYFSGDTYGTTFTPAPVSGGWLGSGAGWHALNHYWPPSDDLENGVARPYLSQRVDTNAGGFLWEGDNNYQIISSGLDDSYGGSIADGVGAGAGRVTIFPTGESADAGGNRSGANKYEEPANLYPRQKPQLDNITSFSNLVLADELP